MFKVVFWYWWALAAVLLVCEMMLPGVVFLFLAIGAAVAGAMLLIAGDVSLEIQLVVFAIVSVVSAIGLRRYLRGLLPRASTSTRGASRSSARFSFWISRSSAAAAVSSSVTEAGASPGRIWSRAQRYAWRPSAVPSCA